MFKDILNIRQEQSPNVDKNVKQLNSKQHLSPVLIAILTSIRALYCKVDVDITYTFLKMTFFRVL